MIKRIMEVAQLTFHQQAMRTANWVLPVVLLAAAIHAIYSGVSDWAAFHGTIWTATYFIWFPFVIFAGIVDNEVTSGRALYLHCAQVGRRELILGRYAGGLMFGVLSSWIPQLPLVIYFFARRADSRLIVSLSVLLVSFLCITYICSILLFFSTFTRSWSNSALLFGIQLVLPPLIHLVSPSLVADTAGWTLRSILYGPLHALIITSRGEYPPLKEWAIPAVLTVLFVFAALAVYRRKEIGAASPA